MIYHKAMDERIKAAERIIKSGGELIYGAFHTSYTLSARSPGMTM